MVVSAHTARIQEYIFGLSRWKFGHDHAGKTMPILSDGNKAGSKAVGTTCSIPIGILYLCISYICPCVKSLTMLGGGYTTFILFNSSLSWRLAVESSTNANISGLQKWRMFVVKILWLSSGICSFVCSF